MFELKQYDVIGKYLEEVINKNYPSKRQFCIAYIKEEGIEDYKDDDVIRRMANRMTQITKGKKAIQLKDLPIFTKLLGVSCEDILSAGTSRTPLESRITNYSIAFSKNEAEWKSYIQREDRLILNPDEYGKTAIDYALEFKNYDFLKFLVDKGYIWFDSRKDNDYVLTFGAGTSIKRRDPYRIDDFLAYQIATEDKLRTDLISLAIENEDIKMLDKLRAREITELYYKIHFLSFPDSDIKNHYNESMIQQIAKSKNQKVIQYFTEEFDICDKVRYKDGNERTHTFMFPYLPELIDMMIEYKNPYLDLVLEKAIEHNRKSYEKLRKSIKGIIDNDVIYSDGWKEDIRFSNDGKFLNFRYPFAEIVITNLVFASKKSENPEINFMLRQLNTTYEKIKSITEEDVLQDGE